MDMVLEKNVCYEGLIFPFPYANHMKNCEHYTSLLFLVKLSTTTFRFTTHQKSDLNSEHRNHLGDLVSHPLIIGLSPRDIFYHIAG